MSHTRRFDHVGITVADLDAVTAFFIGLGLEVETGVRRGRVRPHTAGGRLERLAPTRARPAEACLAVPQASSETRVSDAPDIIDPAMLQHDSRSSSCLSSSSGAGGPCLLATRALG
jgi:hypothetical protein